MGARLLLVPVVLFASLIGLERARGDPSTVWSRDGALLLDFDWLAHPNGPDRKCHWSVTGPKDAIRPGARGSVTLLVPSDVTDALVTARVAGEGTQEWRSFRGMEFSSAMVAHLGRWSAVTWTTRNDDSSRAILLRIDAWWNQEGRCDFAWNGRCTPVRDEVLPLQNVCH